MVYRWIRALGIALVFFTPVLFTGPSFAAVERRTTVLRRNTPDLQPSQVGIGGFSASLFKFKVINKDDPSDVAGGWQEADSTLKFADGRQEPVAAWTCTVTVAMPLRTVAKGAISAEKAAEMSADVATAASSAVMHDKSSWIPADFCNVWRVKMGAIFNAEPYKGYYVTVKA